MEEFLSLKKIDGVIITHPPNLRYFTNFTGGEGVFLALPPDWILIVDPRYTLRAREECNHDITVLEALRPVEKAASLIREKKHAHIGLETAHLTVDLFRRIRGLLLGLHIKSLKDNLDRLRMIKDPGEIERIQNAVDIHTRALDETLAWVTPDMTEQTWAIEFEYRAKRHGASALSFETIVASGPRSAIPHATADPVPLEPGSPVVFDHGVVFEEYCSDETATFFTGPPSKPFEEIYKVVKDAHDAAIDAVRPGITAAAIDLVAREHIEKAGFGKYFTHSTGHGVGLEIHEAPTISTNDHTRITPGMVFTIEPGIYIAGKGGVRIEDMVLVTDDGCLMLTKRPKSLTVIFE
jgi:Xaa-Pro aminopeptidase